MNSAEDNALRAEIDILLAMHAAHTVVIRALIQTHPRYEDFQLAATTVLERTLNQAPATAMTEAMKEMTRELVEQMQSIRPASPGEPSASAIRKAAKGEG